MSKISNLINGKEAFQSIDLDDIFTPISDKQREDLQEIIYTIYSDILSVAEENGLTPFLGGGSALGAVRHNGFIPWDDDLDLAFLRKEYELFLDAFEKKYHGKYVVNAPGRQDRTRARFTKILKKGTIFRDMITLPEDELNGIYIDIFPIDNVPDEFFHRIVKGIYSDILAYISSQVFNRENLTPDLKAAFKRTGKINYSIRMFIGSIFSFHNSAWWFARFDKAAQWKDDRSKACTIAAGRKHYFGEIINRGIIAPAKRVPFGSYSGYVFKDVDAYLTHMYGDYMEIPPVEKRERHYVKALEY